MKIELLVGPPGSGKSTLAQTLVTQGYIRISQDDMGREGHLAAFNEALAKGQDILIDRMNFDVAQRRRYLEPAKKAGYTSNITVLVVPRKVCLERCRLRQGHPTIQDQVNAESAINLFFGKYEKPLPTEGPVNFIVHKVDDKQKVIICDLDGTLCNIDHRKSLVSRAEGHKPNWYRFFQEMKYDEPNEWCREILKRFTGDHEIVFCSGRPEEYREVTEQWLKDHNLYFGHLFMRSKGDYRPDNLVKEILLDFDILPQFEPQFVLDDRQQVVNMWRNRGLVCLQCAPGDF